MQMWSIIALFAIALFACGGASGTADAGDGDGAEELCGPKTTNLPTCPTECLRPFTCDDACTNYCGYTCTICGNSSGQWAWESPIYIECSGCGGPDASLDARADASLDASADASPDA